MRSGENGKSGRFGRRAVHRRGSLGEQHSAENGALQGKDGLGEGP